MLGNNLKTILYHGVWYFIIFCFFLMERLRVIFERFVPQAMSRILFLGIATLVFSTLFGLLFLKPTGKKGGSKGSLIGLMILDLGVMLAAAFGVVMKYLGFLELALVAMFLLLQLLILFGVIQLREHH